MGLSSQPTASEGPITIFGEVLFDRFPDGSQVMGGAPFNVAWHLTGFGLRPRLVGRVGQDALGDDVVRRMNQWGMDTTCLQRDPEHPTGTVEVSIEDGEPSFDIVPERAWDFIEWDGALAATNPSLLYLGTLALRHPAARRTAIRLLEGTGQPVFLDVNLRPPWWTVERVHDLLGRADEIKLNQIELAELIPDERDLEARARRLLHRFGPSRLVVTRGADGAVAILADGTCAAVRPEAVTEVVDTVGAGDAFSSVLILGRSRGWAVETTLRRAQVFAAGIVGQRGSTATDRAFYDSFVRAWRQA